MAFRGWTYGRAALRDTEPVGEVIDAPCPQTNEVAALYLIDTPEGLLPFRKKVSPKYTSCTIAHPLTCLVGGTHGLPRNALGMCVVFNRALDTLLMHHVSLGVIWMVTERHLKFSA